MPTDCPGSGVAGALTHQSGAGLHGLTAGGKRIRTVGPPSERVGLPGRNANASQATRMVSNASPCSGGPRVRIPFAPAASQRRTPFGLVHSSVTRYGDAATMTAGIVNLTRSDRPSWPLFLERGQPYRRAKDYSAPNRHATDGRRIPPLLKLTMPSWPIIPR